MTACGCNCTNSYYKPKSRKKIPCKDPPYAKCPHPTCGYGDSAQELSCAFQQLACAYAASRPPSAADSPAGTTMTLPYEDGVCPPHVSDPNMQWITDEKQQWWFLVPKNRTLGTGTRPSANTGTMTPDANVTMNANGFPTNFQGIY